MEGAEIGNGAVPAEGTARANLARSCPTGKEKRPDGIEPNRRKNKHYKLYLNDVCM